MYRRADRTPGVVAVHIGQAADPPVPRLRVRVPPPHLRGGGAVTVHLIVQEVKYLAVGRHTEEQSRRWNLFLQRAHDSPRVRILFPITLIGNDWSVECDDREHAEWFCRWLIGECGFTRTMLTIRERAS
jgi:hypothetical protein